MVEGRIWVFLTMLVASLGCTGDRLVIPEREDLFVYVVLTSEQSSLDSSLHAFLLRTGTPIRSPYVRADRFEMRRKSDGALFDWRALSPADSATGVADRSDPASGNYLLPRTGSGGRLGQRDLAGGETYSLLVTVGGQTVTGQVTVPHAPTAEWTSDRAVQWRRVDGASGYSVTTQDYFPLFGFTRDTVYQFDRRIPDNRSGIGTIVRAYEAQLFDYLADRRQGRAGLVGALGVFGAYNSYSLPPRQPAARSIANQCHGRCS